MQTIMNQNFERFTQKADKRTINSISTMRLAHAIKKEMKDGVLLESIVAQKLPMTSSADIHSDVATLLKGVDDFYASKAAKVDSKWIEKFLNEAMSDLNSEDRITYLKNMLVLVQANELNSEIPAKMAEFDDKQDFPYEYEKALMDVVRESLLRKKEILTRGSVQAMHGAMASIDSATIEKFSAASIDEAKAYAAACYIATQRGNDPWMNNALPVNQPYAMGIAAAANTENSKLMSMYYRGQITLSELENKIGNVFHKALAFISSHFSRALAAGTQTAAFIGTTILAFLFFNKVLHFGQWIALIGSAALFFLAATQLVDTDTFESIINTAWEYITTAWDAVANAFKNLFAKETMEDIISETTEIEQKQDNDIDTDAITESEELEEINDADNTYEDDEDDENDILEF